MTYAPKTHSFQPDPDVSEYCKCGVHKAHAIHGEADIVNEGIAALGRLNTKLREELAHYKWRPIAEIHDDCGTCVLMDIHDPGYLEVGSNLNTDFDESTVRRVGKKATGCLLDGVEWKQFPEQIKFSAAGGQ